jgi:hypothetical protein
MLIVSALSCLLLVSEYGADAFRATAARLVVVRTQSGQSVELAPAQRLQQGSYACISFDVKGDTRTMPFCRRRGHMAPQSENEFVTFINEYMKVRRYIVSSLAFETAS